MRTYDEVANSYEMQGEMSARFIKYMRTRWGEPETEERHCIVGYAQEWASRFIHGTEFWCSDREGQAILRQMHQGD